MYCSSCGASVPENVSYCPRCGAKRPSRTRRTRAKITPDGLVWALVSVLLGGLGIVIGLTTVLKKELGFSDQMVLLFALVSFGLVVAVSAAFLYLLLFGTTRDADDGRPEAWTPPSERAIGPATPAALEAPLPVAEVTTRTLEAEPVRETASRDTAGR